MLRIVTHIEQLLLMHDCIIIPKLGGFVLQNLPARYRADEHSFFPTRKEVVFNTTLQHDDGLLSESYMQMYGTDYRQARLMWEEDVEELKSILQQEKMLFLGRVGSFETGEEGQLIFHPGDARLFSIESYGLPVFELPSLNLLASEVKEREEVEWLVGKKKTQPVFTRSTGWNFFRGAAATAAAIALFLVISTPVKEVNQAAYTASFVPTEMVAYKTVAKETDKMSSQTSRTSSHTASLAASKNSEAVAQTPPTEKAVSFDDAKNETKTIAKPAVKSPKPAVNRSQPASTTADHKKMYHIVIASFPSEMQANEYMARIDPNECKHVSKVVRDGRHRIYADKFDNRKDAENYMATLRKNPKYKDAWLFISR